MRQSFTSKRNKRNDNHFLPRKKSTHWDIFWVLSFLVHVQFSHLPACATEEASPILACFLIPPVDYCYPHFLRRQRKIFHLLSLVYHLCKAVNGINYQFFFFPKLHLSLKSIFGVSHINLKIFRLSIQQCLSTAPCSRRIMPGNSPG